MTQTRNPLYCFENFLTIKKFETAHPVFSGHLLFYMGPLIKCAESCFCLLHTSGVYNFFYIPHTNMAACHKSTTPVNSPGHSILILKSNGHSQLSKGLLCVYHESWNRICLHWSLGYSCTWIHASVITFKTRHSCPGHRYALIIPNIS